MLRNSETWKHIISNLKHELSEVRSEYGGLKIQSSGDDTRQSIAHRSTPCVAVAPPLFFPSSGPGPLATSSAAHSPFVGREVRPPNPWPAMSWDAGKYTWPPVRSS